MPRAAPPTEGAPHPNDETEKPVHSARDVASQFVRGQMLAQIVLAAKSCLYVPCAAPPAESTPHPNDRTVEFVIPTRDVASQFARKHMLPHFLLAEPAFYP